MDRLPNWLRWVLILPLSVLAYVIVRGINVIGIRGYVDPDPDSFWGILLSVFVEGTISVAAMLYTAYYIAPSAKKTVLVGLSILLGIACVVGVTLRLTQPEMQIPLWQVLLSAALTIGTSIYTCVFLLGNKVDNDSDYRGE